MSAALSFSYDELTTEVMEITPHIAEAMLAHNVKNRGSKQANISKFVRDMAEDNWSLNGEAIRFSKSGRLLDGQNRLMACIESGHSFKTVVIYGLDEDAQLTMDGGAVRTLADALTMLGYENAAGLQTSIYAHMHYLQGEYLHCMSQPPGGLRATIPEGLKHFEEHPGLDHAVRYAMSIRAKVGIPSIGALAVAFYECSRIDMAAAEEFFSRLANYQTEGRGDPLATLLQRVGLMRQRRENMLASTGLYMLFRTWNAWRKGQKITQLPLGSEASGWSKIPKPR